MTDALRALNQLELVLGGCREIDIVRAALAAPAVPPTGYIARVRAAVDEQKRVFPGEEPDYLWRYTHGTKDMEDFERAPDLEVVRLYTAAPTAQQEPKP